MSLNKVEKLKGKILHQWPVKPPSNAYSSLIDKVRGLAFEGYCIELWPELEEVKPPPEGRELETPGGLPDYKQLYGFFILAPTGQNSKVVFWENLNARWLWIDIGADPISKTEVLDYLEEFGFEFNRLEESNG
jgi:hypothetical protein